MHIKIIKSSTRVAAKSTKRIVAKKAVVAKTKARKHTKKLLFTVFWNDWTWNRRYSSKRRRVNIAGWLFTNITISVIIKY